MTSPALIFNGVPWFDDEGHTVNAHGSCIVHDNGRWYLFGEYKTDAENEFNGFSCYSSDDLCNWHFERLALPVQKDGRLGPHRVGERVKVMHCPSTGKYVMYAHSDDLKYMDPCTVTAVSDTIDGEYRYVGPLTLNGEPVRRWDMGTFQDDDGTGYVLTHEGDIYRLSEDYLTAEKMVAHNIAVGGESPAMMHAGDTYFIMFSNKTSWDSNDNYYLTAPSPEGPWTHRGLFCPKGSCTWNSQCSFIFQLPLADGTKQFIYTGDRWSFPHQASSASYVWMPLIVDGDTLSVPEYWPAWSPATATPVQNLAGRTIPVTLNSDAANETVQVPLDCKQDERLALLATTDRDGGYAAVTITDADGTTVLDMPVNMFSPTRASGIVLITPAMPAGTFTLTIQSTGTAPVYYKKNGEQLGSSGTRVRVDGAELFKSEQ